MLIFSNIGEIDPRLITIMGASIKPTTDSPIGHFGTGLKYAIAIVLRHKGEIEILSGEKRFTFHTTQMEIRDKEISAIYMSLHDGSEFVQRIPLPFTLDYGKEWEPWMAYRELWSNMKDEAGSVSTARDDLVVPPRAGLTHILVRCPEIENAALSEPIVLGPETVATWADADLEIFPGPGPIFYRGIRIAHPEKPQPLYSYNILSSQTLREDRTLDDWTIRWAVSHALAKCDDQTLLEIILSAPPNSWEHRLDFSYIGSFSDAFRRAVQNVKDREEANASARRRARELYSEDFIPRPLPQSSEEAHRLTLISEVVHAILPDVWTQIHIADLGQDYRKVDILNQTCYVSPEAMLSLSDEELLEQILDTTSGKAPARRVVQLLTLAAHFLPHPLLAHWSTQTEENVE